MRRFYMRLSPQACAVAVADAVVGRAASRRLTSVLRVFRVFFLSSGVAVHSPIDCRRKAALRRPDDPVKKYRARRAATRRRTCADADGLAALGS
ncbi:hypothetical protein [Burkholderia multivorans]|uniref:hypothetical protein n=1 Tax=Burkholderia multivorans TaxID=87883 RepID=UPI0012D8BA3D|nr:hypothetical protein [Burkholderia multivorans]